MKVLGIRIDPQKPRYAVVEKDGDDFVLLNADGESRLVFPANLDAPEKRANWLYRELERIIHDHPDIEKICVKTNEYTQNDTKAKRRETRITDHCHIGITNTVAKAKINKFVKAVVEGL